MPQELELIEQLQSRLPNLPGLTYDFGKTVSCIHLRNDKGPPFIMPMGIGRYKQQATVKLNPIHKPSIEIVKS